MYEPISAELEKKYVMSDFPLNIAIEITNHCNLNCIMCGNSDITRPRGFISDALYKKIIDEVAQENPNTRVWLDFYGEPLLAGYRLYYFIDYAKKRGLKSVFTNSNATLLKKEYADMLLDSGIDYISLDCDGYTKETFEKIRRGSNRDVVYANIEYLLQERNRRNSKTCIDVKVIEMAENKEEVPLILEHWRKLGAWTAYRRMSDWNNHVMTGDNQDFQTRIACGHAVGTCAISWDGEIPSCVWDGNCDLSFGNVKERTIKEIWMDRNEKFIRLHCEHRWDELPKACQRCNTWRNVGEMRFDENGSNRDRNYSTDQNLYEFE